MALRSSVRACAALAALAWGAGVVAILAFGLPAGWERFDPRGLTDGWGPLARWDSVWFLTIAQDGYDGTARAAFFPLYPLLVGAIGVVGIPEVLAGVALSAAALVAGLVAVHRLALIDLGPEVARDAVWLVALFPAGFYFLAVYSESLYLALSAGAILAARTGRWGTAAALAALAAGTRSIGIVLLIPLVVLLLYGPRSDRPAMPATGWRPRHRPGPEALWLALVPLGLVAYVGYLEAATGDGGAPFAVQEVWLRAFAGPFGGVWDGLVAAWQGARQLLSGAREPVYFTEAGGDPFDVAARNLMLLGFLIWAAVALAGALRRLPLAYGLYSLGALAVPLSYPVGPQPLMSLPRFLAVLFPLQLAVAVWARGQGVTRRVLAAQAAILVILAGIHSTWRFVA